MGHKWHKTIITRLNKGTVLKSDNVFARLDPKKLILKEQHHTIYLYNLGFAVAKILSHGETPEDQWYFTERSLSETTFRKIFEKNTRIILSNIF